MGVAENKKPRCLRQRGRVSGADGSAGRSGRPRPGSRAGHRIGSTTAPGPVSLRPSASVVISETGRNPLLQPLQIGGCWRYSTAAPATDRGGADVGIGRRIKALKIHTGGGVHSAAATRAFLEQGTIGSDLEPRDCWAFQSLQGLSRYCWNLLLSKL